jgi:hypothetical protein
MLKNKTWLELAYITKYIHTECLKHLNSLDDMFEELQEGHNSPFPSLKVLVYPECNGWRGTCPMCEVTDSQCWLCPVRELLDDGCHREDSTWNLAYDHFDEATHLGHQMVAFERLVEGLDKLILALHRNLIDEE